MQGQVMIFAAVFSVAVLFFAWSCWYRFRLVALGRPDNRFDHIGRRTWNMLVYAFGQRRVVTKSYPFGLNHMVFFWCFIILLIANAVFLLQGLFPQYIALLLLPTGLDYALAFIFDIVSLLALLAVLIAMGRRLLFPPRYIDARSPDAFVILGLVTILMLAYFGLNGSEIAIGNLQAAPFMPVSNFVGGYIFASLPAAVLPAMVTAFWWVHTVTLLGFLDYLPYSKHMHILTSIPNCFFSNAGTVNTIEPEIFAAGNSYGVDRVDRFRWKDLFDAYSCTECGRCNDNCPATITGKALNPRLVIHDIKINLLHNGPALEKGRLPGLPLIGGGCEGSVGSEAIWDCTTCGACMEVCPVFIEHVPKLVYMRRSLVEMQSKFPDALLSLFENMENRSNPWGIIPAERGKWAVETQAPPFEKDRTEYLFYVGCAGSFDTRNKRNTLAIANIMNAAGLSWGILGREEKCCGDSLRRLGNEYIFDLMAKENVGQFRELGVKKIIAQCPHCYNTLKNDYLRFGADFQVLHHSEIIRELAGSGKLKLKGSAEVGKVVFHDSCYLGRYNHIFDQPRELIAQATGRPPLELERSRARSFCCGAGGGRMWMEENTGRRINIERVGEVLKKEPDTICVACPYCVTMMEDGLGDLKMGDSIRVLELSEIVEMAL
ncbi:MAG: (Fe-S)-binding protein [Chloroflexi bacterium]|nr:(Fe-S)-binding protein [Chloroflexota bacterium]